LIAGTGANGTKDTIDMTKKAELIGYDAALVITPYYYKPHLSEDAYVEHFKAVASSTSIPILIYNVPIFTGVDLSVNAIRKISAHRNVIGVKESSGIIAKVSELVTIGNPVINFSVLSGSGSYLLPVLMAGGTGGVMALANVLPRACTHLVDLYKTKQYEKAASLQGILVPINQMITKNLGIPAMKAAMERVGYHGQNPRKPLLPLTDQQKKELDNLIDQTKSKLNQFQL